MLIPETYFANFFALSQFEVDNKWNLSKIKGSMRGNNR